MNGKKILLLLVSAIFVAGCGEKIKDKEIDVAPRITLIGPTEVFFNVDDIYVEYGYTATDVDGNDVTSLVRRDTSTLNMGKEGSYQVSYVAVDRKGVKSDAVYRTVNVGDAFAPEITISGSNPLLVKLNGEFSPPTATAMAYDGTDLSDSIEVNAESVDTTKVGTYIVSYTVTDSSGVTGTAQLYVYVLESSSPRIIVEGVGAIADNPYPLQVQGSGADDAAVRSYLNKALPYFQAYDLEDGDISYKVMVSEDTEYSNLISALKSDSASDGTVYALSLTVSDSDGNTPSPLPVFYVTVVTDTIPPVITLDDDQAMYTIEIDAWNDNTAAWNTLFQSLGAKVIDNSWQDQEAQQFTPNTPIPGISSHGIDDTDLRNALTINGDKKKFGLYYDSDNLSSGLNYKTVTLWAKDEAGNTGTKTITVYLTDNTPPVIEKSPITIPFGVSTITDIYQLKWKDNSGAEGVCAGLTLAGIQNAMVEGSFNVTFTASHTNNATKISTLTYPVKVASPLDSASGGTNYMNNNLFKRQQTGFNYNFSDSSSPFTATDSGVLTNSDGKMSFYTPVSWSKTSESAYWYWATGVVLGNPVGTGSKNITNICMADEGAGNVICTNLIGTYNGKTVGAYYVVGARNANSTTIRGTKIGISARLDNQAYYSAALLSGVTYQFGYKIALTGISNLSYAPASKYEVVLKSENPSFSIDATGTPAKGEANKFPASHLKALSGMTGEGTINNWETFSATATVGDKNITSYSIAFSVIPSEDYTVCEYGCLLTDLFLVPVKWKGKQDKTNPDSQVGYWNYDTSSGAVTWSEN